MHTGKPRCRAALGEINKEIRGRFSFTNPVNSAVIRNPWRAVLLHIAHLYANASLTLSCHKDNPLDINHMGTWNVFQLPSPLGKPET